MTDRNHQNATWLFVIVFIWQRTAFEWLSRLILLNKHIVVVLVLLHFPSVSSPDLDEKKQFSEAFIEDIVKGGHFSRKK